MDDLLFAVLTATDGDRVGCVLQIIEIGCRSLALVSWCATCRSSRMQALISALACSGLRNFVLLTYALIHDPLLAGWLTVTEVSTNCREPVRTCLGRWGLCF